MININNAVKIYVEGILELLEGDSNWKKTVAIWQLLYNHSSLRFFGDKDVFFQPITKENTPNNLVIGDKMITEYFHYCQNDTNLCWNMGKITIYPSGEYESSFTWYNEAHLEKLVFKAENLFSLLYYEISACPAFKNAEEEPITWQEAIVTVLFKSGKVQPLNVEVKTATNEIIHYSEAIEEAFGASEYQSSRGYYEEIYQMMNEGELKALYPRWNIATIHIKYGVRFDFEKHVILEWREETA